MAHGDRITRLGHGKDYRKNLFRRLYHGLIQHGKVCTHLARAKALQPKFERLITIAKRDGDVREKFRLLKSRGLNESDAQRMISEIAPKYKERNGGYTSLLRAGFNTAQNPMALLRTLG